MVGTPRIQHSILQQSHDGLERGYALRSHDQITTHRIASTIRFRRLPCTNLFAVHTNLSMARQGRCSRGVLPIEKPCIECMQHTSAKHEGSLLYHRAMHPLIIKLVVTRTVPYREVFDFCIESSRARRVQNLTGYRREEALRVTAAQDTIQWTALENRRQV
jgi:hypothetical protein